MNLKMFKEKSPELCKECKGTGVIKGTQSTVRAACLFCHGTGNTDHGSRIHTSNLMNVMKWCEDYIDDKSKGWYH